MTELILIRHGQTDLNREPRFQGQIDIPLNARGIAQARRLPARLATERIDVILSSDLSRARQTAEPSSDALALQAVATPRLREQGFGIFEGLSFDEINERHPQLWVEYQRHDPDFAPPGGESVRTFHRRVVDALIDLALTHKGATVAVFTHGGVLDMTWRAARGLPLQGARECLIPNAGLNRIRIDGDRFQVLDWGDDAHVADLLI